MQYQVTKNYYIATTGELKQIAYEAVCGTADRTVLPDHRFTMLQQEPGCTLALSSERILFGCETDDWDQLATQVAFFDLADDFDFWYITTTGALYHYCGGEATPIPTPEPAHRVTTLLGGLRWLIGASGKLYRYENEKFTPILLPQRVLQIEQALDEDNRALDPELLLADHTLISLEKPTEILTYNVDYLAAKQSLTYVSHGWLYIDGEMLSPVDGLGSYRDEEGVILYSRTNTHIETYYMT